MYVCSYFYVSGYSVFSLPLPALPPKYKSTNHRFSQQLSNCGAQVNAFTALKWPGFHSGFELITSWHQFATAM